MNEVEWDMKNLQIKEGVIHRGRRPRWRRPSEICRILHILRKPNSIIASLFIQNIPLFLKESRYFALIFSAHQNNTALSPSFLGQGFNNLQRAALLTSLVQYLVNSSWLWWIMRAVLTNQNWRTSSVTNLALASIFYRVLNILFLIVGFLFKAKKKMLTPLKTR